MTLEQAIKQNPYDPNKGNLSAYCRYLRYNVDDFFTKTNDEVKKIYKDYTKSEKKKEETEYQRQVEQYQHDALYEPTFDLETGSM